MPEATHYQVLGVAPDADAAEIKKAYRKLVRRYHPDVSKEPDAAEKTVAVNLAYETLSDPERRAAYDEELARPQGASFHGNPFGGGQPENGFAYRYGGFGGEPFDERDFHFEDLFTAFRQQQQAQAREPQKGEDQHAELAVDIYAAYTGAERSLKLNVPSFDDYGRPVYQEKTLNVKIPKGIGEGQQIRLAGQGLPGRNGAPAGDLYISVHVKAHKIFERNGLDLHCELPISFTVAALGGEVEVPTLDGKVKLNIPKETQTGRRMRVKGKGIKSLRSSATGDLYCHVLVETPVNLTDRQKELLEEFEKISTGMERSQTPRKKSFWDKVGDLFD